ncbi:hypothetical protein IE53DRAFT_208200 [Violaceomyces palustris]|uniref:Uncharacterized protein n=1 Tax=Violaceomyces palustris TaxID=1673888 RepID=A0ACD0NQW1_9BASI|nr:hypothetical protein IE53DRAFT_208200 [Violaceomyces palustris]
MLSCHSPSHTFQPLHPSSSPSPPLLQKTKRETSFSMHPLGVSGTLSSSSHISPPTCSFLFYFSLVHYFLSSLPPSSHPSFLLISSLAALIPFRHLTFQQGKEEEGKKKKPTTEGPPFIFFIRSLSPPLSTSFRLLQQSQSPPAYPA